MRVAIFKMLFRESSLTGSCVEWGKEDPPRLKSTKCTRLPHMYTHSVVISVLADLLMLTCSTCLLGS